MTLDALARMRLVARRRDAIMRIEHASSELRDLAALAGLDEILFG
jgi:hypothetical protein